MRYKGRSPEYQLGDPRRTRARLQWNVKQFNNHHKNVAHAFILYLFAIKVSKSVDSSFLDLLRLKPDFTKKLNENGVYFAHMDNQI